MKLDRRLGWVWSLVGLTACVSEVRNDDSALSGGTGVASAGPGASDESGGTGVVETTGLSSDDGSMLIPCDAETPCPEGEFCSDEGFCIHECNDVHPCHDASACCGGTCIDLQTDAANCGQCGNDCGDGSACVDGQCVSGSCQPGFADCNGDASDGCETQGDCSCAPGETRACYDGPAGTEGVGACLAGTQTCNAAGSAWGGCSGAVTPVGEICGNAIDDDCDGQTDEDDDSDGDGFGTCSGDCCDAAGPACLSPELVNRGAFDVNGNGVDDDCDGTIDNAVTVCDGGIASDTANVTDYARALDLCNFTTEDPADPASNTWGVISASLTLADGSGSPNASSRAVRDGFGNNIDNRFGNRLAVLSTGRAADDAGDTNPSFATFQNGQSMGTSSPAPSDWLAANGNAFPNAPGCSIAGGTTANNPVMLTLRVRVPTNAQSFSVDMFFFSAEYPEYVCTSFNDFFVTLIDSEAVTNPADKNIAVYDDGADLWPVGINILAAADGLFTACQNGTISQCSSPSTYTGCTGTELLSGTGFDRTASACGFNGMVGGGTGWLTMSGNVVPGEVIDIRFAIWDTGDQIFDSLVLLDNWQWSVEASDPGVTPG